MATTILSTIAVGAGSAAAWLNAPLVERNVSIFRPWGDQAYRLAVWRGVQEEWPLWAGGFILFGVLAAALAWILKRGLR